MTEPGEDNTVAEKSRGFEGWMLSNFAMGAGFSAFVALLIPPYVTEVTGDVAASGAVMAVISLAAVLGPVLGTFADKYRAHRAVLSGGVLGMAVSFAMFALSAESAAFYAIDAILLGVSIAAVSAVGPVFIVGAGLSKQLEAKRMTMYSLAMPCGQVAGGLLITAAAKAKWSFTDRFWLAAAFSAITFVAVLLTSGPAERRLHAAMDASFAQIATDTKQGAASKKIPLKTVLFSSFGAFLLVHTLSSVANNGINNQISNIMPNVYGLSEAETSGLISMAGLLNIALFLPAGKWMAKSGAFAVYTAGTVMRLVGALGMALVGWLSGSTVIIAIAFMQVLYQSNPFSRLAQPGTAVSFAKFPAGAATGWLIAAAAMGSFIGSVVGGLVADKYGFNAVNWMGAIAAGAAVLLTILTLLPAIKHRDQTSNDEPISHLPSATT